MVDRGVGLDRVDQREVGGQRVDRAVNRRHDADAERVLVAERAPDRRYRVAHGDGGRIAERNRVERVIGGIDLEEPHVVEHVPADHLGRNPVAVLELDVDPVGGVDGRPLARVRDHVRVGQDVALRGHHEPRALGDLGAGGITAELREDRHDARSARRVDPPRVEAVAGQRLGVGADGCRHRDAVGQQRRGAENGGRRARADPAGQLPDRQRGGGTNEGAEDCDCGELSGAHGRRTVAVTRAVAIPVFTAKRSRAPATWATPRAPQAGSA